jgi:tetratricopeptide (TPR) repeat protein
MVGFDPRRLAEVIVTDAGGPGRRGSGYRVTATSVLTTAHVVADARAVTVRFNAEQPSQCSAAATVGWCDTGTDLAVLVIDALAGGGEVPAVGYGRVGDVGEFIDAHTAGFPLWKLRHGPPDRGGGVFQLRDLHHGEARVAVASNRRTGRLEVEVSPPRDNPDPGKSPWEGMSGAPLWAGERIIGVIAEHHRHEGPNWLTAIRIDRCLAAAGEDRRRLAVLLGLPSGVLELADVTAQRSTPATVNTLPADTAAFTGRGKDLQEITATVSAAAEAGRVVAIHAIDGMPGVGKTALAVHVGHLLGPRFPDRQLFVDLYAHTAGQRPSAPHAVLASLLTADGVDPRYLPDGLDARAMLWRKRMADKRVLLILDNAASSDQVVPLLPGSAGSLVLVTSRRYLGDLPSAVVAVPLDTLPHGEAQQMFLRLAPRAVGQAAAAGELVGLCGHLPLAISLLAGLFAKHRSWTMRDLIAETKARLLTVTAENRTVAAAFDLSYRYLPVGRQRLFRLLGLHPGVDIDAYAAAALTGVPLGQAVEHLDALHSDHLLDEPVYHRYRLHDLIGEYTRALAVGDPAHERDLAVGRLLDFYQYTATVADTCLARHIRPAAVTPATPPVAVPDLPDRGQALAWMQAEHANLLACVNHARSHGQHALVVGLTASLASFLRIHGPWTQAIDLHTAAVAAARHRDDRLGEANALNDLGVVRWLTGDLPGAAQVLERALGISRDLGDRLGEANALNDLGVVRRLTGDYPGAAQTLERALGIYRDLGHRLGEANTLHSLGVVRRLTGDYPGAAQTLERALGISRDLGDRLGEANALLSLGVVRYLTGDYPGAAQVLGQALGISRDLSDRRGEANAYNYLGVVRYLTGDCPGAAQMLEQALGIYRDLSDRLGEANAVNDLGVVRRLTGDYPGAAQMLEQALGIYRDLSDRLGEANALNDLGVVRYLTGDCPGAARLLEQALSISRDLGDRHGEAEGLNHSGTLRLKSGDPHQALAHHGHAVELARAVHSPLEEARALEGAGRCVLAMGQVTTAKAEFWQALMIYQRIGAAEASRLAADLADLEAE